MIRFLANSLLPLVLLLALLAGAWMLGRTMVIRLRERDARLAACRTRAFPGDELHPLLRPDPDEETVPLRLRTDPAGTILEGKRLPDAEEEKLYPYYRRTGQIICNAAVRTPEQISSGSWYGYGEWLQDLIAGRADPKYFKKKVSRKIIR